MAEAEEFKRLSPSLSPEAWKQGLPYKDQRVAERAKRIFEVVLKTVDLRQE